MRLLRDSRRAPPPPLLPSSSHMLGGCGGGGAAAPPERASCGTHLGGTKEVASTKRSPEAARRWISSSFVAAGITPASFCSPSRGPTSYSVTAAGSGRPWNCARAAAAAGPGGRGGGSGGRQRWRPGAPAMPPQSRCPGAGQRTHADGGGQAAQEAAAAGEGAGRAGGRGGGGRGLGPPGARRGARQGAQAAQRRHRGRGRLLRRLRSGVGVGGGRVSLRVAANGGCRCVGGRAKGRRRRRKGAARRPLGSMAMLSTDCAGRMGAGRVGGAPVGRVAKHFAEAFIFPAAAERLQPPAAPPPPPHNSPAGYPRS